MSVSVALSSFSGTNVSTGIDISHAHVGTPKGVLVTIIERAPTGDRISGVTYGGEDLVEVTSGVTTASPIIYTNAEPFTIHYFFLGSGVPAGTQTATISPSSSGGRMCVVTTFDGAADLEINDLESLADNSGTDPSYTFGLGSVESLVLIGFGSGYSAVGNVSPYTGWSQEAEFDLGSSVAGVYSYDTVGTSDPTNCGYNTSGSDDVSLSAIAINEIAGGTTITGTGGLSSADSTASGTGNGFTSLTGTGTLTNSASLLSGTGNTFTLLTGTGSAVLSNSLISGTGSAFTLNTGTGALNVSESIVSGSGSISGIISETSANLVMSDALLVGSGVSFTINTGTGTLTPSDSLIGGSGTVFSSVTGTGDLSGLVSIVSGSGTQFSTISASVTLTPSDSLISGSGVAFSIVTGSGALVATDSLVVGSIPTNFGDLISSDSVISGTGSTFNVMTGSGTLVSATAAVSGSGLHFSTITGSGNLNNTDILISGSGIVFNQVSGSGSLEASDSTITSTTNTFTINTGTGALTNTTSLVSGSGNATTTITGTGSLLLTDSLIIGVATGVNAGSGNLVSDSAIVAGNGTGFSIHTGSGTLSVSSSVITATSNIRPVLTGTGALVVSTSVISGSGSQTTVNTGTGNLIVSDYTLNVTANFYSTITGTGALQADDSVLTVTAKAITTYTTSGTLVSGDSSMSGTGSKFRVATGVGHLVPTIFQLSGTGQSVPTANGNLIAGSASISGTGLIPVKDVSATLISSDATIIANGVAYSIVTGSGTLLATSSLISAELSGDGDDLPVAFNFTDVSSAETGRIIESNTINIIGITVPVAVSVIGGEYSINGGTYTTTPGFVNNNDALTLRSRVPEILNAQANVTVTVGILTDTYTITATEGIGELDSQLPILHANYGTKSLINRRFAKLVFPVEDYMETLVVLTKKHRPFEISETAQVSCKILSMNRSVSYTGAFIQAHNQIQANWTKAIVNITIPGDDMRLLQDDTLPWDSGKLPCWLEIEIRDSIGVKTFYTPVSLSKYCIE